MFSKEPEKKGVEDEEGPPPSSGRFAERTSRNCSNETRLHERVAQTTGVIGLAQSSGVRI